MRPGPTALLGLALVWGAVGCKGDDPMPPAGGTFTATPSSQGGAFLRPLDTVPNADGSLFYFLAAAEGDAGELGVYKVASAGGTAELVFKGAPLTSPLGIAISSDDKTLYLADPLAGQDEDATPGSQGRVFALPAAGGMPQVVAGTTGLRPRSLDVVPEGGVDAIYFSGTDSASQQGAVFKVGAGGGSITTVAKGAPITDPSGIAVKSATELYVVSTADPASGLASVVKVAGGSAQEVLSGIMVGYPAGAALNKGGSRLFISGKDMESRTDVVYNLDLGTLALTKNNQGIAENTDAAGLHRARNADIFSWADLTAGNGRGIVYRIEFK